MWSQRGCRNEVCYCCCYRCQVLILPPSRQVLHVPLIVTPPWNHLIVDLGHLIYFEMAMDDRYCKTGTHETRVSCHFIFEPASQANKLPPASLFFSHQADGISCSSCRAASFFNATWPHYLFCSLAHWRQCILGTAHWLKGIIMQAIYWRYYRSQEYRAYLLLKRLNIRLCMFFRWNAKRCSSLLFRDGWRLEVQDLDTNRIQSNAKEWKVLIK